MTETVLSHGCCSPWLLSFPEEEEVEEATCGCQWVAGRSCGLNTGTRGDSGGAEVVRDLAGKRGGSSAPGLIPEPILAALETKPGTHQTETLFRRPFQVA